MSVDIYGSSNRGLVRTGNEDGFLVDIDLGLLLVADGMGGHVGGEVASRHAIEKLREAFVDGAWLSGSATRAQECAKDAIAAAHDALIEHVQRNPSLEGMGTTLVLVLLREADAILAHVGDSRAYLMRDGELQRLTEDHSLVADMVRIGQISEAQARVHPKRNIITQALGAGIEVRPKLTSFVPSPGDVLMLCTDGLHGLVEDERIAKHLSEARDSRAAVDGLITEALAEGGDDNVTVVVARWESLPGEPAEP